MKGLNTQETKEFLKFWELIENEASKQGCMFYSQAGYGDQRFVNGLDCESMWGWLIPKEKCSEFEKVWVLRNMSCGDWDDYFMLAAYTVDEKENIKISFR